MSTVTRKGIRKLTNGKWQAFVRVNGKFRSKCFDRETALTTMKRWRVEQQVRARLGAELPAAGNGLRNDVSSYLEQVQTMPTYSERKRHLEIWIDVFGPDRDRPTITAGEIRAQLERWRKAGYAASSLNHRRTALMHLWSVLDGKTAYNPAREAPRYHEELGPPRALSLAAVAYLLDAMGPSQTRARLELLRWTGWPHAQMAKLQPADIRWDDAVFVRARRKGKGVAGAWLPLLPQAWDALKEFRRLGCWGKFSAGSMRKSLRLAARHARRRLALEYAHRLLDRSIARAIRAELLDVTPYQLRHTFLTLIAGLTRDDRAVKVLAQHSDIRQTHRYTQATADPRALAALQEVARKLQKPADSQN